MPATIAAPAAVASVLAAPPAAAPAPPNAGGSPPPASPRTSPSTHPSIIDEDEASEWPTRPPPAPLAKEIDASAVDGVERPAPVVVGAPVEEGVAEKAFESRERLVAAEPVAPEELAAPEEPIAADELIAPETREPGVAEPPAAAYPSMDASAPEVEAVVIEDTASDEDIADQAAEDVVGDEVESPASSRRPVAPEPEDRIAQIAFGADEPRAPLHTPPPESGRLPAATVADFDADVTGVRDAAPMPSRRPDVAPPAAAQHAAEARSLEDSVAEERTREIAERGPARAATPVPVLTPDATHPDLPASDEVAEAIGEAQRFASGTFVALLEASLAL